MNYNLPYPTGEKKMILWDDVTSNRQLTEVSRFEHVLALGAAIFNLITLMFLLGDRNL
jgi:hypothetical protein